MQLVYVLSSSVEYVVDHYTVTMFKCMQYLERNYVYITLRIVFRVYAKMNLEVRQDFMRINVNWKINNLLFVISLLIVT